MTHSVATSAPSSGTQTSHPRRVLAVMCAGMFIVLLDVTAVNVALPSIGTGLHTDVHGLQWVVDAYAVAIAGLLLAAGTLGDRIGHRRVVMLGFALFGVASVGCALAPTVGVLVTARAVQGVGAALLLPGTMALIADAYPLRSAQARALGTWAAVSSLALPAGPVIGGALVSLVGWQLVFWINIPIVVAVLVAITALAPADATHAVGRLDLAGSIGPVIVLSAGVFAIIEAGRGAPMSTVLAAATVAICTTAWTLMMERRRADPALPLNLLRQGSFAGPNLVAMTMNLVFNGTLFVTTLYLQQSRALSPVTAGVAVLPMAVPLVLLAPVSGRLIARFGPRMPVLVGCSLGLVGGLTLLGVSVGGPIAVLLVSIMVTGLGGGLITTAVVSAAIQAAPRGRAGLATGVSNTARQVGTATGVAVFGAIAGSPAAAGEFTYRIHVLGIVAAVLWLIALTLTWTLPHRRKSTSVR